MITMEVWSHQDKWTVCIPCRSEMIMDCCLRIKNIPVELRAIAAGFYGLFGFAESKLIKKAFNEDPFLKYLKRHFQRLKYRLDTLKNAKMKAVRWNGSVKTQSTISPLLVLRYLQRTATEQNKLLADIRHCAQRKRF